MKASTLIQISGIAEIWLGIGHSLLGGILFFEAPEAARPLVKFFGFPEVWLDPIATTTQEHFFQGISLIAGACGPAFGAILIWAAQRTTEKMDPVLWIILAHQVSLLILMFIFIPQHKPAIANILLMIVTLAGGLYLRGRPREIRAPST